eukprot:s2882_g3.t1
MISWISISITYDYWPSTGPLKDFTYTWVGETPATPGDLDVQQSVPEDPVHASVVQLRKELTQKLCWQEEILNEILRRVDRPRGPPPALVATAANKSSHEEKEIRKDDSNRSHASLTSRDEDISWVEWLVGSPLFDAFCALIVVSNSIFLGIMAAPRMGITYFDEGLPLSMSVVQYVYAAWFLLELMLRIRNDGWNFIFTPDWSWNLLDVFVVLTSLWDSWK